MKKLFTAKIAFNISLFFALLLSAVSFSLAWYKQNKVERYRAEINVYKECVIAKQTNCGAMPVLK